MGKDTSREKIICIQSRDNKWEGLIFSISESDPKRIIVYPIIELISNSYRDIVRKLKKKYRFVKTLKENHEISDRQEYFFGYTWSPFKKLVRAKIINDK